MRLLLLLALVLAAAPAAHAWTTAPKPASPSGYDALGADGGRWAVTQYGDGAIAVFDDRAPGWRVLPTAVGCRFDGAVGGDRAVLLCPGPNFSRVLTLIDLRSGAQLPVGGPPAVYDTVEALRVGTRWIEARVSGYHYSLIRYYRISDGTERAVDRPRRVADLDRPQLDRPLCSPLRRPAIRRDIDNTAPYEILQRDAGVYVFAERPGAYGDPTGVFTWRCGTPRPRRLLRCPCANLQTGGGTLTAQRAGEAVVVGLADRRIRSVALDRTLTRAVHTRRHLVAAGPGEMRYRRLPRQAADSRPGARSSSNQTTLRSTAQRSASVATR